MRERLSSLGALVVARPRAVDTVASSWRFVAVTSYVIVNLIFIGQAIRLGPWTADWVTFQALVGAANPYQLGTAVPFVWSPFMAPVMSGVVQLGYWPWVGAHVAVLALLRDWRLIALIIVSYGFWFDVAHGNTLTFALVAGILAVGGSRISAIAYLGLLVLMPRPLMLPLAAWLVWQQPGLRLPLAIMISVHSTAVLGTGWGFAWFSAVVTHAPSSWTIGPTALIGPWWLIAAVPIVLLLTVRGHIGWAGLAISPYVLPQYLLWPLLDTSIVTRASAPARQVGQGRARGNGRVCGR